MKTKKDRIANFWDNVFWYAEAHECLDDLRILLNGRYYPIKNKRNGNISLTTLFAIADALDVDEAGIFFEEVDNAS